jgi:hypothetical protein
MADLEDAWTLSFRAPEGIDISVDDLVTRFDPYVVAATMEENRRCQLVLETAIEDKSMDTVIYDVLALIGENYPGSVVIGHIEEPIDA